MVSFVSASVVGVPSKMAWASTAVIKHTHGEVALAVSWSGSDKAPHEGRRFVKALDSLRWHTIAELYTAVQDLMKKAKDGEASLALIARSGSDSVLLLTHGFGSIALLRDGVGRWIIPGERGQAVLEGDTRVGDRFLLQTAAGEELGIVPEHLAHIDVESAAGMYYPRVQQHQATSAMALLFVETHGFEGEEDANVVPVMLDETDPEDLRLVQSASRTQYLIDPSRLQAGIAGSLPPQTKRARRLPGFAMTRPSWSRVRVPLLQLGVLVVLLTVIIGGTVGYRAWGVQREYREVVAPLETTSRELAAMPEDQRTQQRQTAADLLERVRATKLTYNANRRRLKTLEEELQQRYNAVSGQKNVVELPVFYDFRLISNGLLANRADVAETQAVFFDTGSNQAVMLDLATKKNERLETSGLGTPKDVVLADRQLYVLTNDKLQRLNLATSEVTDIAPIPNAQEPTLLGGFGDNMYVFDRSYQQLWRVPVTGEATASAWIRSARGVDFAKITSLSINGSVWMASSDGNIYKFTRGERENFTPQGLLEPFASTLLLATTPEGEKLVVVEPAKKRAVVLNKDGEYQQQIESDQIGAITDVFLEADESAVYLVGGSVVYRVGL